MLLGYARVSTLDQKPALQLDALTRAGCERIFTDEGIPKYSMGGDASSGEAKTVTMSKSEISDIMNKLDKVNDLHLKVKESYDGYTAFIKSWADMVKGVDRSAAIADCRIIAKSGGRSGDWTR